MHAPRPACAAVEAKPLQIVSAAFPGGTILSALFSPFEGTWLGLGQHGGVLTTLLYGLLFLMVCAYGSWDFRFLHLLGGVVVFNAVIGLLQYAGLNPLYLYPDGTNFHDACVLYNGAFLGTLGNVDLLSAFLCLTVPVFYSAFLLTGRKTALLPMGSGVFLLMLADVDSGYLGLAAGLLWRCLKHREQPPILFLLPGILAYLAQSCFTYSYCAVAALFWVFLALCEQTTNFQKGNLRNESQIKARLSPSGTQSGAYSAMHCLPAHYGVCRKRFLRYLCWEYAF